MSWHIDNEGIHIDASCLEVIHSDLKEIEWRLKCEPRTVGEKNAMNVDAFRQLVWPTNFPQVTGDVIR